jgi:hypothetical protein
MNIKSKVKKFISNKTTQFASDSSEVLVDLTLKKDLINKIRLYRTEIDKLFPYYLDKYVTICKYLYNDFNIETATFDGDTDLSKEIKLHKTVKKIFKGKIPIKVRFLDKTNVNKNLKKWWVLSNILKDFPHSLDLLKTKSKENIYNDIIFDEEIKEYERNKYLIEDFAFLEKCQT